MALTPQLRMLRPNLDDLPELALPAGFSLSSYRPGDGAHWQRLLAASFGGDPARFDFDRVMRREPAFRPERVLFLHAAAGPVATASAWRQPDLMREAGSVHYVAVLPEAQGHHLGYWITLATLHRMRLEGCRQATLTTDDFRLPAIKTYLRLGFAPLLVHENQPERWRQVLATLGGEALRQRYATSLATPVWEAPRPVPDDFDYGSRLIRRRRQHPERAPGRPLVGDSDAFGDESLYQPSRLGRGGCSLSQVVAGTEAPFELWFEAGPDGLPAGCEVRFFTPGQIPLGTGAQTHDPRLPGFVTLVYAGAAGVDLLAAAAPIAAPETAPQRRAGDPARALGFAVRDGRLAPGERVTLKVGATGGFRWTPLAGRLEIKVLVDAGAGEPGRRLPEPLVVTVLPGPPASLETTLPATFVPGAGVTALVRLADAYDNRVPQALTVSLRVGPQRRRVRLVEGLAQVPLAPRSARPWPCRAGGAGGLAPGLALTIPRRPGGLGLFFGDLHAHDLTSHACGYTGEVYRWARDEKGLDFVSVVPQSHAWHDNERWALHKHAAEAFLDEGRFVTFLGFEWQHSHYGDKVVHYLGGDQPYLPVDEPRSASPARLYEALRGSDALVIGHHGGYALDQHVPGTAWEALETDVERLAELWSMHGSSEGWDPADRPLRPPRREAGVMAALRAGLRLGFTAGSDTHSGRPGGSCREPRPYWGGLCAVWAEDLSRRGLFAALQARRTYAVAGRRVALEFTVNDSPMGSEIALADQVEVRVRAWAAVPVTRVEVVRNAAAWQRRDCRRGAVDLGFADRPDGPAFYHARVTLSDGSLAVCSPVWVG